MRPIYLRLTLTTQTRGMKVLTALGSLRHRSPRTRKRTPPNGDTSSAVAGTRAARRVRSPFGSRCRFRVRAQPAGSAQTRIRTRFTMKRSSRRPAVLATAAAALVVVCGALQFQPASAAPAAAVAPHRRLRRPGRRLVLRSRAQGLPGHRREHDLEGLVHGRGRRPVGRLRAHRRQHERRDAAVRRHRRLDLHRPADPRHDLHRRRPTRPAWSARSPRPTPSTASSWSPPTSPIRSATRC